MKRNFFRFHFCGGSGGGSGNGGDYGSGNGSGGFPPEGFPPTDPNPGSGGGITGMAIIQVTPNSL